MKITVMTADEQIITLDVDRDESVENLKALLEVETSVPLQQQQLLFNGKEMRNSEKLSVLGVNDGDLVMMVSGALSSSRTSTNDLGFNPDGSAVNPSAFQQHIRNDANMMAQLFQNDPELAQIVLGNDLDSLQALLRTRHRQRAELRHQQDEELALLHADPFDVEAQKKIEAAIRQKGIDENWAAALEHNPEGFARVIPESHLSSLRALSLRFEVLSLTKQCEEIIEWFKFNKKLFDSGKNVELSYPNTWLRCSAVFPIGLPINVERLKQFYLDGQYCDVDLHIEGHGHIARAHKIVLGLRSIPFTKMFTNGMSQTVASTICFKYVSFDAFWVMLEFMYNGEFAKGDTLDIG